jgi:hypothetical protein
MVLMGRSESRRLDSRRLLSTAESYLVELRTESNLLESRPESRRSAKLLRAEKNAPEPEPTLEPGLMGLMGSALIRGDVIGLATSGDDIIELGPLSFMASDASRTAAGTGGRGGWLKPLELGSGDGPALVAERPRRGGRIGVFEDSGGTFGTGGRGPSGTGDGGGSGRPPWPEARRCRERCGMGGEPIPTGGEPTAEEGASGMPAGFGRGLGMLGTAGGGWSGTGSGTGMK